VKGLTTFVALLMLVAGCSSGGGGDVSVTLDEFSVRADPARVKAGEKTFDVRNTGSVKHDFLILATERDADDLPIRKGSVVDTDARGIEVVEHIHTIEAGAEKSVTAELEPGPYLLICNLAGHYSGGMRTEFEVR
jgi:uncharacterized cupredoxin-like copper-binding protein